MTRDDGPTMKIFGLIPCKAGWPRDAWLAHYQERHGPLVASVTSFQRHFLAYSQNYILRQWRQSDSEPVAGISELWVRSASDLAIAFAEPDYVARIRSDELHFTDQDRVRGGVGAEQMVRSYQGVGDLRWAEQPRFKLFHRVAPREGVLPERLQAAWREAITPAAACVRRHVLTAPLPDLATGGDRGAIIEQWWFDDEATATAFGDALDGPLPGPLDALVDPADRQILLARTHLVFGDASFIDRIAPFKPALPRQRRYEDVQGSDIPAPSFRPDHRGVPRSLRKWSRQDR